MDLDSQIVEMIEKTPKTTVKVLPKCTSPSSIRIGVGCRFVTKTDDGEPFEAEGSKYIYKAKDGRIRQSKDEHRTRQEEFSKSYFDERMTHLKTSRYSDHLLQDSVLSGGETLPTKPVISTYEGSKQVRFRPFVARSFDKVVKSPRWRDEEVVDEKSLLSSRAMWSTLSPCQRKVTQTIQTSLAMADKGDLLEPSIDSIISELP
jgi:hypothetical protein